VVDVHSGVSFIVGTIIYVMEVWQLLVGGW